MQEVVNKKYKKEKCDDYKNLKFLGSGSYDLERKNQNKNLFLKKQSITASKNRKEEHKIEQPQENVTIVNYKKMPSSFFKESFNCVAFSNRELL